MRHAAGSAVKRTFVRNAGALATVVALGGFASEAQADDTVPSVTLTCETCSTLAQLRTVAETYFETHKMVTPPGYTTAKLLRPCYWSRWNPGTGEPMEAWFDNCTVAVVTSKQYPLTAYFEFSSLVDNDASASAITPSDLMARDLDNRITARASAMPTISIPAGITDGSEWEGTIMLEIQAQAHILPGSTVSCGTGS